MSNSDDFSAIQQYFGNNAAKTPKASDVKTAFTNWAPSVSTFLGVADDDLSKAKRYRDDFNAANNAPKLQEGEKLTAEEEKYFQNMPVVNTSGMTPEQAQKAVWTKKAGTPNPPASSKWLATSSGTVTKASHKTLRQGSIGEDVKAWQAILGVMPDGKFGLATLAATKKWQAAHGLTANGIVGPDTWAKASELTGAGGAPVPPPSAVAAAASSSPAQRGGGIKAAPKAVAKTKEEVKTDLAQVESGMLSTPKSLWTWIAGGLVGLAAIAYVAFGAEKSKKSK